jgi:hypothetical protein
MRYLTLDLHYFTLEMRHHTLEMRYFTLEMRCFTFDLRYFTLDTRCITGETRHQAGHPSPANIRVHGKHNVQSTSMFYYEYAVAKRASKTVVTGENRKSSGILSRAVYQKLGAGVFDIRFSVSPEPDRVASNFI